MSAGFYSAPLLGSFCIFASAMLARDDAGLPTSWRRAGQVALTIAVLFTFSRAIIGFGLALILRAAHRRGTRGAHAAAVVAAALAVVAVASLTVTRVHLDPSKPSATKVTVPLQQGQNDRLQEVRSAFDTLVAHPVLGTGPNSYPARFDGIPYRAHFTPLNVAATTGLPALLALIGLIVALWRARRRPTDMPIWTGLAGLGIDAIGQDVEHFRHVWIMLGLADADRREGA
jgi:O-antigen ligase